VPAILITEHGTANWPSDQETGLDGAKLTPVVTLTKLIDGNPAVTDALPNEQTVKCPRCSLEYRLGYSDSEWNKVKDWLKLAETALRRDHEARHQAATVALEWRGIRRR
jgi:hypothetical protein